jgi:hypothetical protein
MSEPENFLERWSRRKRAAAEQPEPEPQTAPAAETKTETQPAPDVAEPTVKPDAKPESEPFDLSSLPSLESIDATTNVSAFLRPGVPEDLTREALRRAWTSDPAIRDFVGLVENGWAFNDPNAMHGFGPIAPEEVARLIGQVVGIAEETKEPAGERKHVSANDSVERVSPAPAPEAEAATISFSESSHPPESDLIAAPQNEIAERDTAPDPKPGDHV